MRFLIDTLVDAATGVISGFGVGGGTLLVLYLTLFSKVQQLQAQGINLLYFIPCAVSALFSHIKNKRIDYTAWLVSGGFGTLSALGASYLATRMEMTVLPRIFGGFLVVMGLWEIISVTREKRLEKKEG